MKTIKINPDGGVISAEAIFLGKMVANYELFLSEKNGNGQTTLLKGDNTNPEDDKAILPSPVITNDGKKIALETGFYALDKDNFPDYEIRIDIYQDNKLIGSSDDSGKLTGKGQYSLIFILLSK
jgi:hypothetical protein